MGALNIFTKSLQPIRSHVIPESAGKSPLLILLENALGKTRQLLRVFCREKNEIAIDSCRQQHRLPVEYFKGPEPTVPRKQKFLLYRPGLIQEVTSKWVSGSLAGSLSKESRKKIFQGARGPLLCFAGFGLAKKSSLLTNEEELEGFAYEVRVSYVKIGISKCVHFLLLY